MCTTARWARTDAPVDTRARRSARGRPSWPRHVLRYVTLVTVWLVWIGGMPGSGDRAGAATTNGTVAGTVHDGPLALDGMAVWVLRGSTLVAMAKTNTSGRFAVSVPAGTYTAYFYDPSGVRPTSTFWLDQPDAPDSSPVTVASGATTIVDQQLYLMPELPVPAFTGNANGPTIAVIGDSITQQSTHALHVALDPTQRAAVRGVVNQTHATMQPVADKFAAAAPHQVVVALGTNDAKGARSITQVEGDMEQMYATFARSRCINVLTINDHTMNATINTNAAILNTYIRKLPASHPNVRVVDWEKVADAHIRAGNPGGQWFTDSIHLNSTGQDVYGQLMARAAGACDHPSALAGNVYDDLNHNGRYDTTDRGLAGARLTLVGTDPLGQGLATTVVTGPDGTWSCHDLREGTYSLTETPPPGYAGYVWAPGSLGGTVDANVLGEIVVPSGISGSAYRTGNAVTAPAPWAAVASGTEASTPRSVAVDGAGNAYVTGSFSGTVTFGTGTPPIVLASRGATDLFVAEYDRAGVLQWVRQAGGSAADVGTKVAIDDAGHVLVAGTVDTHAFLAAYSNGGTPVWVRSVDGTSSSQANGVAVDRAGNVSLAGTFSGAATFGGTATIDAARTTQSFVAQYRLDGTFTRVTPMRSGDVVAALDLTVDGAGNAIVAGYFDDADFGGGVTVRSRGGMDAFVAEYGADGTVRWAAATGGSGLDFAVGVATDPATGQIVLTGGFSTTATFGTASAPTATSSGGVDAYVAAFAASGETLWVRTGDGPGTDFGTRVAVAGGHVHAVGQTGGGATFTGTPAATYGGSDGWVATYGLDGTPQWLRTVAGAHADGVWGVAGHPDGSSVVAATFTTEAAVQTWSRSLPVAGPPVPAIVVARLDP